MTKILAALALAAAMIATQPVVAQDKAAEVAELQAMKAAVQKDKRAYVASVLKLTDAEAKKFWPLYDAYQRALNEANRRRNEALEGAIVPDKPVSDLYAKNIAGELIAADEIEIKARRTLHNRVMKALPAKKAARYLQLESKIRAVQFYDIAVAFPLIK
jgi:Spy/CpxP family protein refolding chaperone